MARKERIDTLLVSKGLAVSRHQAQALVMAGEVLADDVVVNKPGTKVLVDASLRLRTERSRYVSRGGHKLEAGLSAFEVDPTGLICADLGASTGGFTDCLLQHGAARVYAVDVGYGQLAWTLRQDPRVVVMERTNARNLESLPEAPSLVVADLSFISITKVLPAMLRLAGPGATAVILVKPQFEAGPDRIGHGGVVRDAEVRQQVIDEVSEACEAAGARVLASVASPLPGAKKGNIEELLHLALPAGSP